MTDCEFWREKWAEHRIGFHIDRVHPDLLRYEEQFLDGAERVLVPLCGKTIDLAHLQARGIEVVGVELIDLAVGEFHEEQGIEPAVTEEGPFRVYRSEGLTIYCGDIFDLGAEIAGHFDRIWDRAALIALDRADRVAYSAHLRSLVRPEAKLLASLVEYDQTVMSGPPWSLVPEEVDEHYGDLEVTELHREEMIEEVSWKERGHQTWVHSAYLVGFGALPSAPPRG